MGKVEVEGSRIGKGMGLGKYRQVGEVVGGGDRGESEEVEVSGSGWLRWGGGERYGVKMGEETR